MINTISHIFHVDLSKKLPNEVYWLYVGGKKYEFNSHTSETIAKAKLLAPSLKDIPDERLTHFTREVVEMPADKVMRISVRHSTVNTEKIPNHYGIHHVKLHVPPVKGKAPNLDEKAIELKNKAIEKYNELGNLYNEGISDGTVPDGTPPDGDTIRGLSQLSTLEDFANYYFTHGFVDSVSTAECILRHHPDHLVFDLDTANVISEHFSENYYPTNYYNLQTLANFIDEHHGVSDTSGEGWAYWKPFDASDAIEAGHIPPPQDILDQAFPNNNKTIDTYYMLSFGKNFNDAAGPCLSSTLNTTKNDLRLKNKKWMFEKGLSVRDIHDSPAEDLQNAQNPNFEPMGSAKVDSDDNWHVELANKHKSDGLVSSIEKIHSSGQSVEIKMKNSYVRWLAVYVQFIDANGSTIQLSKKWRSNDVSQDMNASLFGLNLQYLDMRYLGVLSPIDTVEGVPIMANPGSGVFSFDFPEEAVQAKFYGCGMGNGNTNYPYACILGGGYTAFSNLAIPGIFLMSTAAALTNRRLYDWMNEISTILTIGRLLKDEFALMIQGRYYRDVAWEALEDIAKILFKKAAVWALGWVSAQLGEAAVEDSIPGVGWVVAANNILVDTALITQTCTEVATSPATIENKLSVTIDSTIKIKPDPRHLAFPRNVPGEISRCELKIYRSGDATSLNIGKDINLPTPNEIDYVFSNQLGGQVKFEVNYYVGTRKAAQAATSWMNNDQATVDTVDLYLVETPVPITPASTYLHAEILTYKNGAYQWSASTNAPTSTRMMQNANPTGNHISQWNALSLSQRYGMIAPSFKAAGLGISAADSGSDDNFNNQLSAFQNFDIPGRTMRDVQFPSEGFLSESRLIYDVFPPKFKMKTVGGEQEWDLDENGHLQPDPDSIDLGAYYIDPRKADSTEYDPTVDGGYHLRKVSLHSPVPAYNMNAEQNSWGRFPYYPDAVTIHPLGYVIGVNFQNHKLMALQLPEQANMNTGTADEYSNMARAFGGVAQNINNNGGRAGLLFDPIGITCTYDGTIIVLEQSLSAAFLMIRLQAFDIKGNPVYIFDSENADTDGPDSGKSPFYYLPTDNVTYLDVITIGDKKCTYIYLLSYEGQGSNASDYKISVYKCLGKAPKHPKAKAANEKLRGDLIFQQTGIPAAHINVDMWHTLYTLNYEMTKNGTDASAQTAGPKSQGGHEGPNGRTVPSISEWVIKNGK